MRHITGYIASTKIVRDTQWQEFIVRAYDENGKRLPTCDYFTGGLSAEHKLDAIATAKAMLNTQGGNL